MAADQPYPIHPTLDKLIQTFKEFQHVTFPRGMPQPLELWKPLLQQLTRFDAKLAQGAHAYLGGQKVDLNLLKTPEELKKIFGSFVPQDAEAQNYFSTLKEYLQRIETIVFLIEDCAHELGNPCVTFKANQ